MGGNIAKVPVLNLTLLKSITACVCVCVCAHVCVCARVHVYTCVHVPVCACICVCVHMCCKSGGWVDGVCGRILEAVRLNFDFAKPSSCNLHFRFLFLFLI